MSEWVSVEERMPGDFVSVLGHMTDAGPFPSVRECYHVTDSGQFFFPALCETHPVSHWMEMPLPPPSERVERVTKEGDNNGN